MLFRYFLLLFRAKLLVIVARRQLAPGTALLRMAVMKSSGSIIIAECRTYAHERRVIGKHQAMPLMPMPAMVNASRQRWKTAPSDIHMRGRRQIIHIAFTFHFSIA